MKRSKMALKMTLKIDLSAIFSAKSGYLRNIGTQKCIKIIAY